MRIVKTKPKQSTGATVLRWILLRHAAESLDQTNNGNTKRNTHWEEMHRLNQY